jgi:hypothetical protein
MQPGERRLVRKLTRRVVSFSPDIPADTLSRVTFVIVGVLVVAVLAVAWFLWGSK